MLSYEEKLELSRRIAAYYSKPGQVFPENYYSMNSPEMVLGLYREVVKESYLKRCEKYRIEEGRIIIDIDD